IPSACLSPRTRAGLTVSPAKPMTTQSTVRWRFTFTLSRRVVTIRFLCHHALQCGQQCEPLLRQCEVARLRHQLQAGVQAREEILESLASVTQRQLRERYTAQLEHIEDDKDRGS